MSRVLRRGMSGNDVRAVQHFLLGLGFLGGPVQSAGLADGAFGPLTEEAVRRFQSARGLRSDGVVGPVTLGMMMQGGLAVLVDTNEDWPPEPPNFKAPSNNEMRMRRWGRFEYRDLNNRAGEIEILGDWEATHIVDVHCPVFNKRVRLHRDVADDYVAFMQAIIADGKRDLLLTHEGAFYPRFIRGSRSILSNHSWGTAFDVNYEWNQLGHIPAYRHQLGSVRELVPLGVEHGWYWGGWFGRRDGMHFEHV